MRYEYFQPVPDEKGRTMYVMPYDDLSQYTYHKVYEAEATVEHLPFMEVLEFIWTQHNRRDRPRGQEIRSMSVGDLVRINGELWMADLAGFKKFDVQPQGID
jgi:hypothetical protein